MVGHQALELLARVLAAMVTMVEQAVRLTSTPNRHEECVRDELRRHLPLHRPADDAPGEQINDGGNVEPSFGGPDGGEVGDPLLIWRRRLEGAVEEVARHGG